MRPRLAALILAAAACTAPPAAAATCATSARRFTELESAIRANPEDLKLAADYRQLIIPCGHFDRSIEFFKRLTKNRTAGPNAHISLALAFVDKVPTSGKIRRLYLARDAIGELTRAIERRPTVLAYHIRGVINLFFNRRIFKRTRLGVADNEKALSLVTQETPQPLVERVWIALGDGYWRDENPAKARETWTKAAALFPANADLKRRLGGDDEACATIVHHVFDEDARVDTSLGGVLP
jgi:tetratricopeptide (TPR) repeat protein